MESSQTLRYPRTAIGKKEMQKRLCKAFHFHNGTEKGSNNQFKIPDLQDTLHTSIPYENNWRKSVDTEKSNLQAVWRRFQKRDSITISLLKAKCKLNVQ